MAVGASMVMTGISIVLLALYGADVGASQGDGEGFLPFDAQTRGMAMGGPAVILPIIAFFISRKEPSTGLGGLLVASGGMIIAGGLAIMALADPAELEETGRSAAAQAGPLMAVGAFVVALGAVKLRQSR